MRNSPVPRLIRGIAFFAVFAIIALWLFENSGSDEKVHSRPNSDTVRRAEVERAGRILPKGTAWNQNSEFSMNYGSDETTVEEDLEILEGIFNHVTILIKDFPTLFLADNRDFTRLLIGNNRQKFAWIHPGHSGVSDEGELLDRWGTPLFFHRESAMGTVIRSAGVDRQMWTADDVLSKR